MRQTIAFTLAISLACIGPAAAQMDHSRMQHATGKGAKAESSKAFEAANMKMHKDMSIKMTGDADVDFIRGMLPHHQGAVDMARIELKYGKDEKARKLAEDIIKSQESEITFMKDWLAQKAK